MLDVVIKHLNLLETSYFGLRYLNAANRAQHEQDSSSQYIYTNNDNRQMEQIWLDVNKSALKQLRDVQPMTVYFGVKYYTPDPCKLAEEITRYQFFLQCKQDILHQRLPVSYDLAIELFALAVQSELGDYDPMRHHDNYVNEFQFAPNQSTELERRVALFHKSLSGQVPATAELHFLERVKHLDLYGSQLHPIQYDDGSIETLRDDYALGLNPTGVLVLRNKVKVAHYDWMRIIKTKCQGRCFLMDVIDQRSSTSLSKLDRNRFGFRLADKEASRRLRWAIEEHKSFYHLINTSATLNQMARRQQQQHHQQHQQQHHQHQQQQHQILDNSAKLSTRFRNSIRSAISVGPFSAMQLAAVREQQLKIQQQRLRSSMKSLQDPDRSQPTVVRMPSRRYSNRSMSRPAFVTAASVQQQGPGNPSALANQQRQHEIMMLEQLQRQQRLRCSSVRSLQNLDRLQPIEPARLPSRQHSNRSMSRPNFVSAARSELTAAGGGAHTMVDSQRHHALMLMNQFQQQQHQQQQQQHYQHQNQLMMIGKSQTLKPNSTSSGDRAKKNQYYAQLISNMQQQQNGLLPPAVLQSKHQLDQQMQQDMYPQHPAQPPPPPSYYRSTGNQKQIKNYAHILAKDKSTFRSSSGDNDDDYCCSRSDCSSIIESKASLADSMAKSRRAKLSINFKDKSNFQLNYRNQRESSQPVDVRRQPIIFNDQSHQESSLIKNIANKQATPILLSMNHNSDTNPLVLNANNKAVQLLNLQRQQLNNSTDVNNNSSSNSNSSNSANQAPNKASSFNSSSSSAVDSASSSLLEELASKRNGDDGQWSPMNQQQSQPPSSLKYVSFDV